MCKLLASQEATQVAATGPGAAAMGVPPPPADAPGKQTGVNLPKQGNNTRVSLGADVDVTLWCSPWWWFRSLLTWCGTGLW